MNTCQAGLVKQLAKFQGNMEGSKRKMTKSLIVIAILLHVIASVPHTNANASDTATAGNSASEQFGMLRVRKTLT